MPIYVSWKIEKRVMHVKFVGDITVEEVAKANDEQVVLLHQGTAPVHQVTDFSEAGVVPLALDKASESTSFFMEPNLGWVTNFGTPNRSVKFVSNILSQSTGSKLRNFNSEEECMAFLREKDPTI